MQLFLLFFTADFHTLTRKHPPNPVGFADPASGIQRGNKKSPSIRRASLKEVVYVIYIPLTPLKGGIIEINVTVSNLLLS
jgi:hypothetical protein